MMKLFRFSVIPAIILIIVGQTLAEEHGVDNPASSRPAMIYVEDFQNAYAEGHYRIGPLNRLESRRQSVKSFVNAASLSLALVKALNESGLPAQRLELASPLPRSGWRLSGVYYALDAHGRLLSVPGLDQGAEQPNAQVTVAVADLATNPDAPLVVFGTAEALAGQGLPVGWNPYVVAARFTLHQVQSQVAIEDLARQIADTLVSNRTLILEKAGAAARNQP